MYLSAPAPVSHCDGDRGGESGPPSHGLPPPMHLTLGNIKGELEGGSAGRCPNTRGNSGCPTERVLEGSTTFPPGGHWVEVLLLQEVGRWGPCRRSAPRRRPLCSPWRPPSCTSGCLCTGARRLCPRLPSHLFFFFFFFSSNDFIPPPLQCVTV